MLNFPPPLVWQLPQGVPPMRIKGIHMLEHQVHGWLVYILVQFKCGELGIWEVMVVHSLTIRGYN